MEKVSNEANKQEIKAEVIEEKKDIAQNTTSNIQNDENEKEQKKHTIVEKKYDTKIESSTFEQSKMDYENKQKAKKKIIKWCIIGVAILAILLVLSTIFALLNINNEKIISGVSVDKVNLQGLTKEEAKNLLNKKIEEKLNKEINVKIDDEEQNFMLSQIEVEYDVDNIVEIAYKIGRKSNVFVNNFDILYSKIKGNDVKLNAIYNKELLDNVINEMKSKIPNAVKEVNFCVEEDKLIITPGTEGLTIDTEELKEKIEKVMNLDSLNEIVVKTFKTEPKDIDIEEIYNEVHQEAKDAYYTKDPFKVYPEVLGIDFNIEEAKELLKEEKEEYTIPLTITKPEKTVNNIGTEAFPDLLSTFTTRYDASNAPRTTNLKLAVEKINGTVVMPGDTFSYNKTVGKRTAEAGYKEAAGYQGGKVVQMTGGGICQISSTLYDAVVMANLDIVERHNHAFTTSYVGAGKDATVVYGALDFKFKNTRNYPISIKASAQNSIAKIDIFGIKEENEYEIDIVTSIINYIPFTVVYEDDARYDEGYENVTQYGSRGCKSVTYKIYKLNGAEVSRTVLSNDTYDAMNKYITRGTKKTQTSVTNIEPVTPKEPTEPNIPTEPVTPQEPETPNTPAEPATPQEPTTPTNPEKPVTPQNPEEPENPIDNEQAA